MKSKLLLILIITSIFSTTYATELTGSEQFHLNSKHINIIEQDDNAIFVPVKTKLLPVQDESLKAQGVAGRLLVSWGKLSAGEMETTFHTYDENGNETSNTDLDTLNEVLANSLELKKAHLISVEYYVTNSLSIELADNYREYGLAGETVGEVEEDGGLFSSSTTSPVKLDHYDKINDLQLGLNYTIKASNSLEFSLRTSAGLVHLDTKTSTHSVLGDEVLNEYDGLAGYSYGAGVRVRYTVKNFFLQGGVDYRNYVIAPTTNDDGSSQEIHQQGTMFYISFGLRF